MNDWEFLIRLNKELQLDLYENLSVVEYFSFEYSERFFFVVYSVCKPSR